MDNSAEEGSAPGVGGITHETERDRLGRDSNRHAREPSLELAGETAVVHGYQEFKICRDILEPLAEDRDLQDRTEMLARFFSPSCLAGRTVLDLGANSGFFSFWALRSGADRATAIDLDPRHLQIARRVARQLKIEGLDTVCQNVEEWHSPGDVVFALALIHWIYSRTARFGSLEQAVARLAELTKYMLIVEWIDPDDPAIESFGHLSWNEKLQSGGYDRQSFVNALSARFARVELVGTVSPTRAIYAAYRTANVIDLSAPLARLFPKESIISSRRVARIGTRDYWSVVYDAGDRIVKQGSRELASREARFLAKLSGRFTPRVRSVTDNGSYSVVELDKILADPLSAAAPRLRESRAAILAFAREFLELLAELRAAGISHRDIRPENVLVRNGHPVLIDFGWAAGGDGVSPTPPDLGYDIRPPDGKHSDTFSTGKLLLGLNSRLVPELDGLAAVMMGVVADARIEDPAELLRIFDLLFGPPPASAGERERDVETTLRHVLEKIGRARQADASSFGPSGPEARLRELAAELQERDRSLEAISQELARKQAFSAAVGGDLEEAQEYNTSIAKDYEQQIQWLSKRLAEAQKSSTQNREISRSLDSVRANSGQRAKQLEFANAEIARLRDELAAARAKAEIVLRAPLRAKLVQLVSWNGPFQRAGRALLPAGLMRRLRKMLVPSPSPGFPVAASRGAESKDRPLPPAGTYDVIVFSIIDWDFRFQRPQQLSTQFSRRGHRVFFLSTTDFLVGQDRKWSVVPKQPGIAELKVGASRRLDIYGGVLDEAQVRRLEEAFASLAEEWAIGDAVCVLEIAFWTPLARRLRERFGWRVVYDCMDEWTNFPLFGPAVLEIEASLVRDADLTVVSADRLAEKWKPSARRLLVARNGIDLDHYRSLYGENQILGPVRRPVLGYFGALASWVDVDLLVKIARMHPAATLVLAGGQFDVDLSPLKSLRNVRVFGQRPYAEMPKLLWNFDVCLIPFFINDITEATNPVKFYEYLFSGKPIVGTELHELRAFGDLCYLARTHEEFLAKLNEALAESPNDARRARRREAAAANAWSSRYEAIDVAVREAYPRVSVVVVTYNGVDLTRDCLESLLHRETWPNLEVIVVDNASSDGTLTYLAGIEVRDPRVRVFSNAENRGFAAANNIGIANSSGDIVVLLNNDTFVPPGLIGRLVVHLTRDPSLGLLCPTTNFCGNEAKVDPGYSDIADLPWFAASLAREHSGAVFDIPVAAMYCVAMRREVAEKVGPLEEAFGIGMFEDDDYAMRMRQEGFRVACARDCYVHHVGQGSFAKLSSREYNELWRKNQAYFEKKWGVTWQPHQVREGVAPPVSKSGA
jgi:GT2 family glycosyltransferase/serine/threonine protein kinase